MTERPVVFGASASLVGILTEPDGPAIPDRPTLILLNAGLVHRVGPNRLHVRLARTLAERGLRTFRFDLSGIGDSSARSDALSFEDSSIAETREAMDRLETECGANRFVLAGICSGALAALRTAGADARVVGVIPVNTQSHQVDTALDEYVAARQNASYLWRVSMLSPKKWKAALTGKIDYAATFGDVWRRMKTLIPRRRETAIDGWDMARELRALADRGARLLMIYSRGDPSWDVAQAVASRELQALQNEDAVAIETVADTDHTFTPAWSQARLTDTFGDWLENTRFVEARKSPDPTPVSTAPGSSTNGAR